MKIQQNLIVLFIFDRKDKYDWYHIGSKTVSIGCSTPLAA